MSIESAVIIETKEHLEQLMAEEKQVILYFSSLDCNVCQAVFPKLMSLAEGYPIKVIKISVVEQTEIAGQSSVFTVPTILIFYEGREILRESRFIDFLKVERTLDFIKSVQTGQSEE
ncbi:thioredoxin family protein [Desulfosporosinus sp.]|uniref:thioredoxin family protein n=1 Tax=Desulfosporosinus sp. TaxID=157907 RepID=UPI00230A1A96|nr:thioredoxin family protein [Desulfosporosinus sp.]MCO5388618.1 thioredoxin family protein [Desulfosporosinus sp.]MDA8221249.1 thioredoxin family protein [Desulfitobacterium hafniense]